MNPRLIDMVGLVFGRLVVLEQEGNQKTGGAMWRCRCTCGTEVVVYGRSLRTGNSRSCGCARRETCAAIMRERHTTHGLSSSVEFRIWTGIKTRCFNDRSREYRNYGGRGITMCRRWIESFADFYADMGPRPSSLHSIERKENDSDYEPDNCIWAVIAVQASNRRTNRRIEHRGERLTLAQWARRRGFASGTTITGRLQRGWTIAEALDTDLLR